tara:strand:- start:1356 stop:5825 length:4470 start_codon:yes stop_codon:yes gene_type:complete
MPEITHHFRAGKMNKDLDERLVPDGEYRDAMNVEVSSSDGANVGAVQNIMGNNQRSFVSQAGQKCIGSIAYGKGDFIIWFIYGPVIAGEGRHSIVQYIPGSDTVHPILVDNYQAKRTSLGQVAGTTLNTSSVGTVRHDMTVTATSPSGTAYYPIGTKVVSISGNAITTSAAPTSTIPSGTDIYFKIESVLKFTSSHITGINIIDGILFWTDGINEPKKIHIKRTQLGTPNILNHTLHYIDGEVATPTVQNVRRYIRERDITVIKKNPEFAPILNMSNTKRINLNGGNIVVESTVNRTFINGSGDPLTPPTSLSLTFQGAAPDYRIGDILILSSSLDDQDFDDEYEIRVEVTFASNSNAGWVVNLLSIHEGVNAALTTWNVKLKQDKPMFEFKFPRFGYRYKYEDGEYSAFSPWSETAFLPSEFDYNPYKGYNLGMTNTLRSLLVKEFNKGVNTSNPRTPDGVVEIDILYKESNNNNVYTVKTIKKKGKKNLPDAEWTADELSIESELIYATVPANQALRPWDNVPLTAKAQEITANRILYGNYTQNYNMVNQEGKVSPLFNLNISPYQASIAKTPSKSLKSQRTYQMGIVYRDRYGRETPVFTDKSGTTTLAKSNATEYNRINISMLNGAPTFAESFKYFIKETSNEYYNLAMDRYYLAEDGNVWLSFPSSERNKIQEDTFLILKKQHSSDEFVEEDARYKVVAISNEAPSFLKIKKQSFGTISNGGDDTIESTGYPQEGFNFFHLDKDDFEESTLVDTKSLSDLVVRFRGASSISKWYDVTSISLNGGSNDRYVVRIEGQFGEDVDTVTGGGSATTAVRKGISVEIAREVSKSKPEFEGRFFAKIYRDYTLEKNILSGPQEAEYTVTTARRIPYLQRNSHANRNWWRGSWFNFNQTSHGANSGWFVDKMKPDGSSAGVGAQVGTNRIDVSFAGIWPEGPNFGVGYSTHTDQLDFVKKLDTVGAKFRFQDDPDQTVYTIVLTSRKSRIRNYQDRSSSTRFDDGSNKRERFKLTIEPNIGSGPSGYTPAVNNVYGGPNNTGDTMEFLEEYFEEDSFTSNNPAIWETEPKEDVGLDIYYEISDAFPISEHANTKSLSWFNCYSFGNGVESNRIRDDFNAITIDKGPRASATLATPYERELKGSGLIFSGIYNSTSGVNNTNQFIQAEAITKDLNQAYGTVQKLHTRDNNVVALCEDKILKIYSNKDALYNADGSSNLVSSNKVLGTSDPFAGEYGISMNPESFVAKDFRAYFTDKNRGVVLRLSIDGMTPISMHGMQDYFRDKLATSEVVIGTYDDKKQDYNLTFTHNQTRRSSPTNETITFSEKIKGWTSRKSFIPESGVSLNNEYYTFWSGEIWQHYTNQTRNSFFGLTRVDSEVTLLLNDAPELIKSFKTLNYEGTEQYIKPVTNDGQYFNNTLKYGWYLGDIHSNLQTGSILQFKEKENKYYNFIHGDYTTLANLDTKEFSVQGLGTATVTGDTLVAYTLTIEENND